MKYVPILRETAYERDALASFGGLSNFSSSEKLVDIEPLVEAVGTNWPDVVERIDGTTTFKLYVDVPRFLEQEYSVDADIDGVLAGFDDRFDFFTSNRDTIRRPVVSSFTENTSYDEVFLEVDALLDEFEIVAPRLIIRNEELSEDAKDSLRNIFDLLPSEAPIFVDFFDIGVEDDSKSNFQWILANSNGHEIVVLNVYDTSKQQARNYGPTFTDFHSLSGFGDYFGGPRLVYPSQADSVNASHYFFDDFEVRRFSGADPTEALERYVAPRTGTGVIVRIVKSLTAWKTQLSEF